MNAPLKRKLLVNTGDGLTTFGRIRHSPRMSKTPLGRGLGALLGKSKPAASAGPVKAAAPTKAPATNAEESQAAASPRELPLAKVQPCSFQPRKEFAKDALEDLANSIRQQGILQPLVVRPHDDNYEIIAGERRWRAASLLKLETVPVIIRDVDDATTLELALVENLQREDLNPIESALGYEQLLDRFELTQEEVAARVGKSRASVANALRLLKLVPEVRAHVRDGRLSVGHAKVILALPSDEEQKLAANKAIRDGLSVRQIEELVDAMRRRKPTSGKTSGASGKSPAASHDTHIARLESLLQEKFGTKVSLRYRPGKGGALQIKFFSDEDLERILQVSGVQLD